MSSVGANRPLLSLTTTDISVFIPAKARKSALSVHAAGERREALTRATIETLQTDNICLAGGTQWHGQRVLRLSLIYGALTDADVDRLAVAVLSAWRHVQQQANT
jgi:hypothetical protein